MSTFLIFFLLSIILFAIYFIYTRYRYRRYYKLIKKLPSPRHFTLMYPIFLLYDAIIRTRDTAESFFYLVRYYGNRYIMDGIYCDTMEPLSGHMVVITSPDAYRDILTDQDNLNKNVSYWMLQDLIGKRNLIISDSEIWKHDRKIINPSFKYSNISSMNHLIFERADFLIEKIKASDNFIPDLHSTLATAMSHLILEAAIGINIAIDDPRLSDYVRGQKMFCDCLIIRIFFFWFPPLYWYTIGLPTTLARWRIKNFIEELVDMRINQIKSKGMPTNVSFADTLIDAYLSSPKSMPKDVVVDHVITFIFVGHKATSLTLNAILFLLASHPEKLYKLQDEIDANFGDANNNDATENMFDMETLNKMTYLSGVIKEGQRMYPISASIGRKVTKEFVCNGYTLPVGCNIGFDFNSLTKNPAAFDYKPEQFIPERFIPGCEGYDENRHPFALLPFSHGLRKCIGEKFATNILKIFLTKLLMKYNISTSQTMDSVKIVQDIMVYFRTPIDITFTER